MNHTNHLHGYLQVVLFYVADAVQYKMNMLYKNILAVLVVALILGLIMISTNPGDFSAVLLLIVFGLLYVMLVLIILALLQVARKIGVVRFGVSKMVRIAIVAGVLPVFMLLLHSIGQLTMRDIFLSVSFFGLLYIYFSRVNTKVRT